MVPAADDQGVEGRAFTACILHADEPRQGRVLFAQRRRADRIFHSVVVDIQTTVTEGLHQPFPHWLSRYVRAFPRMLAGVDSASDLEALGRCSDAAEAMREFGMMLLKGFEGFEPRPEAALHWLGRVAEEGDVVSMRELGVIRLDGVEGLITLEPETGITLLRQAADRGDAEA